MFPCVWLHFKIFSGKYFLVFGKEEGKHKSRKTQAITQKKIINDDKSSPTTAPSIAIRDRDRRRDLAKARSRSTVRSREASIAISDLPLSPTYEISHSTLREIAPSIAISIRRDLAKARSRSTARSRITVVGLEPASSAQTGARSSPAIVGLTGMSLLLSRARACSLSLSLSFSGNTLKGK